MSESIPVLGKTANDRAGVSPPRSRRSLVGWVLVHVDRLDAALPRSGRGRPGSEPRCSRGAALLVVMWLLLGLGLLLVGTMRSTRVMMDAAYGEVEIVQAQWLARAGVEQGMALLQDDVSSADGPGDLWYDDVLSFGDVQLAEGYTFRVTAPDDGAVEGSGNVRFGMIDEAAYINLNTADRRAMLALDAFRDQPQLPDAIVDWRDRNENAGPGGAERGYYNQLDFPYLIRNDLFRTREELLLVRDMTPDVFYGEDVNLNGRLDANEDDGEDRWPQDDADGQLQRGIAALTTIYSYEPNTTLSGVDRINLQETSRGELLGRFDLTDSLADRLVDRGRNANSIFDIQGERGEGNRGGGRGGSGGGDDLVNEITIDWLAENMDELTLTNDERVYGKINVNTAPREVLLALPRVTEDVVDKLINYRESAQGPFVSVGSLYTSGILVEQDFRAVAELVTVRSNVLRIVSEGRTPSGVRRTLTVVVDRGGARPNILYWSQSR